MAEKGFGVKEINLIGASGTPTIESPNNLNLNAVNVAISTNVSIGGTLSVTGNVSVGGTLTYEDVTNIDSVGVITARSGVDVDDFISVGSNIHLGNAGVITATTFSGSGASLTSIPAGNLTGTVADARISTLTASKLSGALPAISGANLTNLPADTPTNSDIQVVYTVTANGSSAYRFAGNGVVSTADDPDLYLIRGQKYRFINNSGGSHPFQIREASGGTAYSTGVTNNGASSGNIDFAPTFDSPAQLVYQCTSHSGMVGNIYLKDGNGNETNVGVTTFSGLVHLNQLKKTSGTLDYLAATHTFNNAAGSTEYLTINSNGTLKYGQSFGDTDGKIITVNSATHLCKTLMTSGNYTMSNTLAKSNTNSHPGTLEVRNDTDGPAAIFGQLGRSNTGGAYSGIALSLEYPKLGLFVASVGGSYGAADFVVCNNSAASTAMATLSDEKLRISTSGFVSFGGDADTGIKNSGANTLQVETNGTLCTEFSANQRVRMPQVYSTNGSSMRDVQIESDGTLCAGNTSIRLSKKNITSQSDVSWLYNLNPVTFNYRKKIVDKVTGEHTYLEEAEVETSYGLIAEEVETVKKDFCFYNDNKLAGVHYNQLITPLLKSLQDQKKEIDILKAEVAALKAK